jgi:hypothetical protein
MVPGIEIDSDEKQVERFKLTAQICSYLNRYRQTYTGFRGFSVAGVLDTKRWRSQWDNPLSSELQLTAGYSELEWDCTNMDKRTFYGIPEEHRCTDRPRRIERFFNLPCPQGNAYDFINLDLTCRYALAMEYIELILQNDWLRKEGFLAVWFNDGPHAHYLNEQFLKKHGVGYREYLRNLLYQYGYEIMADNGVTGNAYKQYNRSSKADEMIWLYSSAARPTLHNAYDML